MSNVTLAGILPDTTVTPNYAYGGGSWLNGTQPTPDPLATPDITSGHKVLVGVLLMVVMLVILTEVAGNGHEWGVGIGLLLLGPLLIEGMTHGGKFAAWASSNPVR